MNTVRLSPITNRQDYSESFQALDEDGNAIDIESAGALIVCEMSEPDCGATTALTVVIDGDLFTISLTKAQTNALKFIEYKIGCTITMNDFTEQFFIGTLPVVDGVVSSNG